MSLVGAVAAPPGAALADSTQPLAPALAPAAGVGFYVNPSVASGLDGERFVSVVQRSLSRWGDAFLGFTDLAPAPADGTNVIAFDPTLEPSVGGQARRLVKTVTTTIPEKTTCTTVQTPVSSYATVRTKVTVRRKIRVRRKGRLVYLTVKTKRGRTLYRNGRPVYRTRNVEVTRTTRQLVTTTEPRPSCVTVPASQSSATTTEYDVALNSTMSWQLGPDHPTTSQPDFESVLLHELGHVAGLGHTDDLCAVTTPMATSRVAGDWWRATDDVSVANARALGLCPASAP